MGEASKRQRDRSFVERLHLNTRMPLYIACQDLNFAWDVGEIVKVKDAWASGKSVCEMATELRRPEEEVTILIMDLASQRKLKPRKGGLLGAGGED